MLQLISQTDWFLCEALHQDSAKHRSKRKQLFIIGELVPSLMANEPRIDLTHFYTIFPFYTTWKPCFIPVLYLKTPKWVIGRKWLRKLYKEIIKSLRANPTKWSNTNCLSVFNHFVGLALKELRKLKKIFWKVLFFFLPLGNFILMLKIKGRSNYIPGEILSKSNQIMRINGSKFCKILPSHFPYIIEHLFHYFLKLKIQIP